MSELPEISHRPPFVSAFLILLTTSLSFTVIGPMVGMFLALPFYDGSFFELLEKLSHPQGHEEIKAPLMILQGSATLIGLIVIPAFYVSAIERKSPVDLFIKNKTIAPIMAVVVALAVISFMATNSIFIDWNYHLSFPDFLKDFENWARERENMAEEITKFFTHFNSPLEFLVGLFVIAVLPAIGEEFVFRGLLQTELQRGFKNHHVAIWVSAILFSAFHMQFFGFVPRMLLGALFGYLYVWSGNIAMPMIAHFVNNGFSVVMMYLNQLGLVKMDVDSPEVAPISAVIVFTIIFAALMVYFKNFYQPRNLKA